MLFQRKAGNKSLNELLEKTQMNMSNNYKDAAQDNFKAFVLKLDELKEQRKLSDKQVEYYEEQRENYSIALNKFTHKDQKPTWI